MSMEFMRILKIPVRKTGRAGNYCYDRGEWIRSAHKSLWYVPEEKAAVTFLSDRTGMKRTLRGRDSHYKTLHMPSLDGKSRNPIMGHTTHLSKVIPSQHEERRLVYVLKLPWFCCLPGASQICCFYLRIQKEWAEVARERWPSGFHS